jgi:hypothetical protein
MRRRSRCWISPRLMRSRVSAFNTVVFGARRRDVLDARALTQG